MVSREYGTREACSLRLQGCDLQPTAYRLQPTGYRLRPTAYGLQPTCHCRLADSPTADCRAARDHFVASRLVGPFLGVGVCLGGTGRQVGRLRATGRLADCRLTDCRLPTARYHFVAARLVGPFRSAATGCAQPADKSARGGLRATRYRLPEGSTGGSVAQRAQTQARSLRSGGIRARTSGGMTVTAHQHVDAPACAPHVLSSPHSGHRDGSIAGVASGLMASAKRSPDAVRTGYGRHPRRGEAHPLPGRSSAGPGTRRQSQETAAR